MLAQSSFCKTKALTNISNFDRFQSGDSFKRPVNNRVKWLRFLATLPGKSEAANAFTPQYCPLGPPLLRENEEITITRPSRSPLRKSTELQSELQEGRVDRDSEPSLRDSPRERPPYPTLTPVKNMPHPTNMPQSGFQALILCGPGIGLSTFTSVPNEYPKALVNVATRPMVWYVLDWCYRMGVTDITLITPPTSKGAIAAALAQNPYLTSLPSPSADLLAPEDLDHTTPTADLLRLPEVQEVIKSDFLLLPCDLICETPGEDFLETHLTMLGTPGSNTDLNGLQPTISRSDGSRNDRSGGLSIWYNTADREESVKKEECDFMCTANLDQQPILPILKSKTAPEQPPAVLRKLVWAMPMSELHDQIESRRSWDKHWHPRASLIKHYGFVKTLTKYRDSHIYLFPRWVKEFALLNEQFESVSEDLVGTWAKAEWRGPQFRAQFGIKELFGDAKPQQNGDDRPLDESHIEDDLDLLHLSTTQTTRRPREDFIAPQRPAHLSSRVTGRPKFSILSPDTPTTASEPIPRMPPIYAYVAPSASSAPLIRRVDTTPLLLSVSLLLAKLPALDESATKDNVSSPFAHSSKIAPTATIAPQVSITRADTLIGSNASVDSKCVIKASVIGSNVTIASGCRLSGCVIMDGASIGEKCELNGTVVGRKARLGKGCKLVGCEVQDENVVADGTEGAKGEKFLLGGLGEDEGEGGEGGEGEAMEVGFG